MISSLNRSLSATVLITLAALSGLAQKPELVVQTGHSNSVNSVAFSSSGKTLASGGGDNTVKLWDVTTGAELRTFIGHSDAVVSVSFSPDGKILASGSWDRKIKLWDVGTGSELRTLEGHSSAVTSVIFAPDGKTLASGSGDHTIKLWDLSTGKELRTLIGHSDRVVSVAFGLDGKILASGSEDQTIKVWTVSSSTELRTLNGHSNVVNSVAFSSDGKTLASGSADHTVRLWDVSTGAELRTLKGHSDWVYSVAFSPDGNTIASSSERTVKLWEVSTGTEIRTLAGTSVLVRSITFSPNGMTLAGGSQDNTIKLWDVSSGIDLRIFKGTSGSVRSLALSPDAKTLATGGYDKTINLWDVSTGGELHTLRGHSELVKSVVFSPDGKTLASGSGDETVKLWDVPTGAELGTLKMDSEVSSIAFSSDGKTLASASEMGTVVLWDVSTGAELRTLKLPSAVYFAAFSPDLKIVVSSGGDNTVKLWRVSTGTELHTLKGHSRAFFAAFSPDSKTLASGHDDETVLWDVSTGKELRALTGLFSSVAFSLDGKTLASGSFDHALKLTDVSTGSELRILKGHSNLPRTVTFSPNNKYLLSGSQDATIKVWEVASGKELASLIAFDGHDWMVVTPDGLFDGSPVAWNKILWRFNNNTFDHAPVEAFFSDFYYPGLLADIFAGKRPKAPSDISQKDRRQPQLKLDVVGEKEVDVTPDDLRRIWAKVMAGIRRETTSVKVQLTNAPAGAQDVRLFRNGSLVKVWHGDVLNGQSSVTLQAPIYLLAGENRLTAYAFNHDNIKSSDATLTITGADSLKRQGVAYILAVGVNQYANSQYNLKYAVADAQDFAAELKLQQTKLNSYERVEIISLNDRDATKANILRSLNDLSIRIQPEDALVIYFAGHGTAQQNRFYLIPHDLGYAGQRTQLDAAGLQNILAHSVSDEEIARAVEGIDAGQMLLVIDACNSGQALEAEEKRRGPMNSKGLAQLAYEKGMYILTAAQSYQAAQEASKLGHGYLTYALVEEGLKTTAADREPKDGQVLLREWLNFATNRVPEMQLEKVAEQKKQGRQLEQIIVFAEGDQSPDRRVQRPRVFYRREAESSPLVVAKP